MGMFFTNHLWPSWGWLIVGFTTLSIIIIHCLYKGTYSHHIPLIHLNPSFCCGKYRMELLLRSLAHGMFRALFHFLHNSWQKEGSEGCTRKRLWHMGQSENGPMVYAAGTQKKRNFDGAPGTRFFRQTLFAAYTLNRNPWGFWVWSQVSSKNLTHSKMRETEVEMCLGRLHLATLWNLPPAQLVAQQCSLPKHQENSIISS